MNKHLNAIRKAGFGSLFTPTKAMSRVRAIATDRTQSSLTGGCFEPGIIRISTEFCGAEGDPDPLGATGPGNVRIRTPSRTCRGGGRSIAFGGCRPATRIRSFFETHLANAQASKPRCRASLASLDVACTQQFRKVLTQAIAASQHWRIIRNGAAQHF